MTLELTVDQFERLTEKLDDIGTDTANLRTESALLREKLNHVNDHLARINGRIGINEVKVTALNEIVNELRGAWKLLAAIASAIGAGAGWIAQHWGTGTK